MQEEAVLRIRDVYPGSKFCPSRIQGQNSRRFHLPDPDPHKKVKYFKPKKLLLSSRKYDLRCSSRIRIPDLDLDVLPIRDTGVKKAPDPGSGSATLEGRINTLHTAHCNS
jgi:hypothetical protein